MKSWGETKNGKIKLPIAKFEDERRKEHVRKHKKNNQVSGLLGAEKETHVKM